MKRVISTKVDGAKYAEFLEYCSKMNKYPANALRDALDLLLSSNKYNGDHEQRIVEEKLTKYPNSKPDSKTEARSPAPVKNKKSWFNIDEDERELEL